MPQQLRHYFAKHYAATVTYMGWQGYKNGDLLDVAEGRFDVLITMDQNLPFQQNIGRRNIAVLLVTASDNQLETLMPLVQQVLKALTVIRPGEYVIVS